MVDSVNSSGGIQNLQQTNKTQSTRNQERGADKASAVTPLDEVNISEEALALAQSEEEAAAQRTAEETRTILEQQLEETLSNDRKRVDTLL